MQGVVLHGVQVAVESNFSSTDINTTSAAELGRLRLVRVSRLPPDPVFQDSKRRLPSNIRPIPAIAKPRILGKQSFAGD
jgi:hypothetical protein